MSSCHVKRCPEQATLSVRFGNNHSFKDRWTTALNYCDEHANKVGLSFADRGLRVLIEELPGGMLAPTSSESGRKARPQKGVSE